jgi:hypothetical protein
LILLQDDINNCLKKPGCELLCDVVAQRATVLVLILVIVDSCSVT